jgi:4-amino-4-deoxy-L-arabinose transferase-like glycosyltransferase
VQTFGAEHALLKRTAWVILIVALAFSALVRWRLAEFPLERDEGEYAYVGQLLLEGIPPYTQAYNMKLPGTYLSYAALMAVFGQTTSGIHLGLLVVSLATILLVFFLTRELFDAVTGAIAAAAFAVMSVNAALFGMAAHATHFVNLFAVPGVWVLWRAIQKDSLRSFFAAGVLLGVAFIMKQHAVFLIAFGGLAVAFSCVRQRPVFSRRHLAACLLYALGTALPFAAICLWLWLIGAFANFWFWTFDYARAYVKLTPFDRGMDNLALQMSYIVIAAWPLLALAAVGGISLVRSHTVWGRRAFVFGFLAFSLLCVVPGMYFRPHYFIATLPSVAILVALGCVTLAGLAFRSAQASTPSPAGQPLPGAHRRGASAKTAAPARSLHPFARKVLAGLMIVAPTAALIFPVVWQWDYYFLLSPQEACRRTYPSHPFPECAVIAEYVKAHSDPGDTVAVLGSEPEVLFYAQRKSATGYLYIYPLMEPQPLARQMQKELIKQIEEKKPKFVVFVNVLCSWTWQYGSGLYIFTWLRPFLTAAYRPVGLVEPVPGGQTSYRWDEQLIGDQSRSTENIVVYQRRP